MINKNKNKKGVSIYLALIVMVIFLGMGFGLTNILLVLKKTIRGMSDSVNTLAAADTGLEYILYQERKCWPVGGCNGVSPCKPNCRGLINNQSFGPTSLNNGATYQAQIIRACGLNTIFATSTYKDTVMRIKFTVGKFKPVIVTNSASDKNCYDYCNQRITDDCSAKSIGTDAGANNTQYYPQTSCTYGSGLTSTSMLKSSPAVTCFENRRAWTNCNCSSTIP